MELYEFKFYKSYQETFDLLSDEDSGKLLKRMYRFYFNGIDEKIDSVLVEALFSQIKYTMVKSKNGKMTGGIRKQEVPYEVPYEAPCQGSSTKDKDKDIYSNNIINTVKEIVEEVKGVRGIEKFSQPPPPPPPPPPKKETHLKNKKPVEKIILPTRSEIFLFMGEKKGVEKFCDILEELQIKQNLSLKDIKSMYNWMIGFFQEKYPLQFYQDKNGDYVGTSLVLNELDKFISYYAEHPTDILCLKSRLRRWITNSVQFNKK